jgi:8-oxo-dGTP pyrophosphatase MutT (NUDIX family)
MTVKHPKKTVAAQTPLPVKHHTAGVIILTDTQPRKILLHCHRKYGKWMQAGGHVEDHENPLETAIREVEEETGIDIKPHLAAASRLDEQACSLPLPAYVLEEKIPSYGTEPEHYHIDHLYVAHIPEQQLTPHAVESQDLAWFTPIELKDLPMFENVRHIALQELTK